LRTRLFISGPLLNTLPARCLLVTDPLVRSLCWFLRLQPLHSFPTRRSSDLCCFLEWRTRMVCPRTHGSNGEPRQPMAARQPQKTYPTKPPLNTRNPPTPNSRSTPPKTFEWLLRIAAAPPTDLTWSASCRRKR